MTRVMTTCHLTRTSSEQAGAALCDCTVLLILCIVEVSVQAIAQDLMQKSECSVQGVVKEDLREIREA